MSKHIYLSLPPHNPATKAIINAIDLQQTPLFAVAFIRKLTSILTVNITAWLNYDSETLSSLRQKLFEYIYIFIYLFKKHIYYSGREICCIYVL